MLKFLAVFLMANPWTSVVVLGPQTSFGYEAAEASTRRRVIQAETKSEDRILDTAKRPVVQENARDLKRNFALAAWAIRKHLDYVASFNVQVRSDDEKLNRQVEALIKESGQPGNCEVTGRHSRDAVVRLTESHACTDGDIFLMKLASGKLQAIEGDRIRNPRPWPTGLDPERMTHGVYTNPDGSAKAYAVHKRKKYGGFEFERMVPAKHMLQVGIFERFDQVRGVTPFTSALNTFRDVYEGFDLALAKAKVAQLFGLTITRDAPEAMGSLTLDPEEDEEDDEPEESKYTVDFGKGPFMLDMEPGDNAKFLENRTPSTEFQSFTTAMVMLALKCLDIPYCFYDEAHTNYSGNRIAWLQYEASAEEKRKRLQLFLAEVIRWRLGLYVLDGRLRLPGKMTLADLPFELIAKGIPWIDPLKEIKADIAAVLAGLDSPQRILKRRGLDAFEILAEIKAWNKYRGDLGLPEITGQTPKATAA